MKVSLVQLHEPLESLRRAVGLCDGFYQLQSDHRVLIKPNIAFSFPIPPYGMVTTTSLLAALVHLLVEHGCRNIAIGEGTVDILGSTTHKGYHRMQIDRLAQRYGLKLIDLNAGPFVWVDLGGVMVRVSKAAFETDFLINVPVLKTHSQTKVSLGFKNLKGFLGPTSKAKFHGTGRLNELICRLNEVIQTSLTIIDGTYVLETGPDTVLGNASRENLIIAGRDPFACDVVGARVMGIDPSEVGYLREYATTHGRSLDPETIRINGDTGSIPCSRRLNWKPDVAEELLVPANIGGLSIPYPGDTLCSRCYATLGISLASLVSDNPNTDFVNAVICCGREVAAQTGCRKTILYGDCALNNNKDVPGACRIEGCPPSLINSLFALYGVLLSKPRMLRTLPVRMARLVALRAGIYNFNLPKWQRYRSGDFDRNHFSVSTQ